jgi:tryptophan 7-halogenase
VVAMGLASGFLEPLESTSIHLIHTAIARLIDFFPSARFEQTDIDEYNRQTRFEYERIRDFIILHYHLNSRTDSEFWTACRDMEVPTTLKAKLELYKSQGRIVRVDNELFAEVGWVQVMHGQGLKAQGAHPLAALIDDTQTTGYLDSIRTVMGNCVQAMPEHSVFIAENCSAKRV